MIKAVRYTCVFSLLVLNGAARAGDTSGDVAGTAKVTLAPAGDFGERSSNVLAKARETNEQVYASLRSFVCKELIQRFRGANTDEAKPIDTVTAKVSFENGSEHYSDVRQNMRVRPTLASIGGAWSEGEFGTLLRQTQALLSTRTPIFERYSEVNGIPAAIYDMQMTSEESPWDLEVKSQHCRVPFHTRVWISDPDGEILKIERVSTLIPMAIGISEIRWNVVLKPVDLNGRTWLLPDTGEYAVIYDDAAHREWNVMHFSDYQRYGSEVAIRFQ